jgi:asparagine N-glycosylation enzyme membrane subunit Stt3
MPYIYDSLMKSRYAEGYEVPLVIILFELVNVFFLLYYYLKKMKKEKMLVLWMMVLLFVFALTGPKISIYLIVSCSIFFLIKCFSTSFEQGLNNE